MYYVNDKGGPTLVVDQHCTKDNKTLLPVQPEGGISCSPRKNQILFFPGDRLHGVLPAEPQFKRVGDRFVPDVDHPSISGGRITLMTNWWVHPLEDPTCVPLRYSDQDFRRYGQASTCATDHDIEPHIRLASRDDNSEHETSTMCAYTVSGHGAAADDDGDDADILLCTCSQIAKLSHVSVQASQYHGKEVVDLYFYDHDGAKERAWEQQQQQQQALVTCTSTTTSTNCKTSESHCQ